MQPSQVPSFIILHIPAKSSLRYIANDIRVAAWKSKHHFQVILDGIFRICNKKMLLLILMGVDRSCIWTPLAFLLFLVIGGNKKTCAEYNMEILHKHYLKWKLSLSI